MTAEHFVPWVIVVTCSVFALAALPSFFLLRERASGPGAARHGPAAAPGLCLARDGTHFPEFRRLLMCIACYQAGISVVITLAAVCLGSDGLHHAADHAAGLHREHRRRGRRLLVRLRAGSHRPRALAITLCGWILMVLVAYAAVTAPVFWVAATLAGVHGHHAARPRHDGALAPAGRLAEFFSLWTFAVQLAAVIGPLTYGLVTWATDGNHRLAILVTGLFFVGGLALLSRVDMARGLARRGQGAAA